MEIKRKPFQGVLNILSFNRHFYLYGAGVLALITACFFLFTWPDVLYNIILALFLYGLLMPLLVSAYVYDFSGYYHFNWLSGTEAPLQIVNINAGFDETSFILKHKFPASDLSVFDFYNAAQHTEPAIVRARKVSLVYPGTLQIRSHHIPMPDHSADLIFLLSAAHEIRSFDEKQVFLTECHRICKPGGKVIMVEHLRDLPNLMAFTVGFTHFFSGSTWKKVFRSSGFESIKETKFTPFMSIFACQP
jgi:SAM-dependent methyltransferase